MSKKVEPVVEIEPPHFIVMQLSPKRYAVGERIDRLKSENGVYRYKLASKPLSVQDAGTVCDEFLNKDSRDYSELTNDAELEHKPIF
jgi:hypothetical protein